MTVQHLLLIRHGETVGNSAQIAYGQHETPLNERGIDQAKHTGALLTRWQRAYQRVYTSTLSRAMHTGAHIAEALSLPIDSHSELVEGSLGDWEGLSYRELEDNGFARKSIKDDDFDGHRGESPNQLAARMHRTVLALRQRHPGENLIIVSHGAAIAHFLAKALGTRPIFGPQYLMHNSAVTEVCYTQGEELPTLLTLNHYEHLPESLRADHFRQDQRA